MLERPTERVMLILAAVLAGLLLADRLVHAPLRAYVGRMDSQAADIRQSLAELDQTGPQQQAIQQQLTAVDRLVAVSLTERQNEFRRYLGERIGPEVAVESVRPLEPRPLGETPYRVLTYHVKLRATLAQLRDVLARLDAARQPLQMSYLSVEPVEPGSPTNRTLKVEMYVLTLIAREIPTP